MRNPLFTQRNFFSETGINMLNAAVTAADVVRHSSEFDPWGEIRLEASPVIADLKSCQEKIVSRRKAVKDTRERWFGAETLASSAVGEAASRTTLRISYVAEVGDVQYVEELIKLGLPCCSRSVSSPGKSKRRRVPVGAVAAKKKKFLLRVLLIAVLHLKLLLRKISGNRLPEEMVVIAVKPQFSLGVYITILFYKCIDLLHLDFSYSMNSVRVAVFCAQGD